MSFHIMLTLLSPTLWVERVYSNGFYSAVLQPASAGSLLGMQVLGPHPGQKPQGLRPAI